MKTTLMTITVTIAFTIHISLPLVMALLSILAPTSTRISVLDTVNRRVLAMLASPSAAAARGSGPGCFASAIDLLCAH